MKRPSTKPLDEPADVASRWESWCGDTRWSRAMRKLQGKGYLVQDWGGVPQSASAIPLCFVVYDCVGRTVAGRSLLRDLEAVARGGVAP